MDKETHGQRLKRVRESKRYKGRVMSRYRLAELSGVSRPNISRIESGEYGLKYETAAKLAPILEVTPEYLLGIDEKEDVAGKIAKRLENVVKETLEKYNPQQFEDMVEVPVLGYVPGGYPMPKEQQPFDPILIAKSDLPKPMGPQPIFALIVSGDSMTGDNIQNGSKVYINPNDKALVEGKVYLVNTEDGSTIKRLILKDGRPVLRASNGEYHDVAPETIEIVGRVFGIFSKL